MTMAETISCKVDRYSNKYRNIFCSNPVYCDDCNGDLIGGKCIESGKELFFLKCRNCRKIIELKKIPEKFIG